MFKESGGTRRPLLSISIMRCSICLIGNMHLRFSDGIVWPVKALDVPRCLYSSPDKWTCETV